MRRRSPLRNWAEEAAARLVLATLAAGPRGAAETVARGWVKLLDLALPRLRRTAWRNLDLALPALDRTARQRIVEGSFRTLARVAATLARFPEITPANVGDWIRYDGFEHFAEAKKRGRGVLFATAHLGNWELSAFAHAWMAEPMNIVVRGFDNPRLDRLMRRYRTLSGNRVIDRKGFTREIFRALARNEAVGVLIDQNVGLRHGQFIDFFGVPACVETGLARVAAASGAAVIPGYALWSEAEKRYRLTFFQPFYATGDATADTQSIHGHLESVIRQYPDQWLWMHKRWKTRPEGEPPLY